MLYAPSEISLAGHKKHHPKVGGEIKLVTEGANKVQNSYGNLPFGEYLRKHCLSFYEFGKACLTMP